LGGHREQFRWESLNHKLIKYRLNERSRNICERFVKLKNLFWSNSNTDPAVRSYQALEAHQSLGDELLVKAYDIYCNVAEDSGFRASPAFVREMYLRAFCPLISDLARKDQKLCETMAASAGELRALAKIARLHTARREAEWSERLDSEAGELEHSQMVERIKLGRIIATLYDELKRLRMFAHGRRKLESELRAEFPNFQLWTEVDTSDLRRRVREEFFESPLSRYKQDQLMAFIGEIVGFDSETTYRFWKRYRKLTGQKRTRTARRSS
jgi:hypothetical protein